MGKGEVGIINASILRQLWSIIEQTQLSLLELDDTDLVKQLLTQLDNKQQLSDEETTTITTYLRSRTSLIRDLAETMT